MPMKNIVSVLILTYNEELHLNRCLASVKELTDKIFIVDSYSDDNTLKIAAKHDAKIYQNPWPGNQAAQFNWALDNLPIKTGWILRLDADEYLLPALIEEIKSKLPGLSSDTAGVILKRRVYFMNKWIRYGGYYPTYLLRLWRSGTGRYEQRWMDEHVKLESGNTVTFDNDFVDDNINNLAWWTNKHNDYSTREAIDLLNIKYRFSKSGGLKGDLTGTQDKKKRWVKENFYSKSPLFFRAFFYFIYRYFFGLGFLDGRSGLVWHFLQGFWYRFLVDAKIYQVKKLAKKQKKPIPQVIKEHYNIDL